MKICLINNLYPPFDRGSGAEVISQILIDGLKQLGHQVIVIACKPYSATNPALEGNYYISSAYHDLNKIPLGLRYFWHIGNALGFLKPYKIKKIIKQEACDLVITNNLMGLGFLTPRFIKSTKIKHIHILHDIQLLFPSGLMFYGQESILESPVAKLYQRLCNFCFKEIDLTVSPSHWLLNLYRQKNMFNEQRVLVLRNPQIDRQISTAHKTETTNRPFVFLSVGQVDDHKGVPLLVKAFNDLLADNNLNCQLLVIGGGSRLEELKALSHENIKFLGKVPNHEVHEAMQTADCLVVPSLCYENSPTIIFEALYNDLPVLASRIGGIGEILQDNDNLLFEPGNHQELKNKLLWAVQNSHELRQQFNKLKADFRPNNACEYFNIINEALNKN